MSAPLDLQLGRLDLLQIGANRRGCLRVLASSKGKKSKIVTGGEDGVVQCAAVKKGETSIVFKNPPGKREVTALALGGPAGAKDRIYAAFGQTIQGLNKKKGAQFFLYATVLNEDISSLFIEDLTIYTGCEYSLNVFEANKNGDQVADVQFYQSPDRINAVAQTKIPGVSGGGGGGKDGGGAAYNSVLGCQDKHLRVIKDSSLFYEARVDGAVSCVALYESPTPPEKKDPADAIGTAASAKNFKFSQGETKALIYTTDNGNVGQYFLGASSMRPGFVMGGSSSGGEAGAGAGSSTKSHQAGITALALCDVTLNGFDDLVIGRDDGRIEVFPYDVNAPESDSVFSRSLNESVTTIAPGQLIANNSNDLVVSTFSGKVVAYTHELKHSAVAHIAPKISNIKDTSSSSATTSMGLPGTIVAPDGSSTNVMKESSADLDKSIRELKLELEKLTERVLKEKEKYCLKVSPELIATEQQFHVKHSFKLLPDEACYLLSIELDIPLDCVMLQSNIPVMLLDVEGNRAMLSRTERDEKNNNELLACYRIQAGGAGSGTGGGGGADAGGAGEGSGSNRIELKIRTVEGQHGTLLAYLIPKLQPKTCQRLELKIKPLSLHEKVHRSVIEGEVAGKRPMTSLTINGDFSLADIHSWVGFCLPEVPSKPSTDGAVQSLSFRSTFLRTVLSIEYEKGRGRFLSDSVTAISILKEVITKDATTRKISIGVELDLNLASVQHFLQMMRPQLDATFLLARKCALIAPLKEIATHEIGGGVAAAGAGGPPGGAGAAAGSGGGGNILAHLDELSAFLQPSYIDILAHSAELEAQLLQAPRHLDFLRGIVTDLLVDKAKLQGKSAQAKVPQLMEILENYSFEKLLQAFKD